MQNGGKWCRRFYLGAWIVVKTYYEEGDYVYPYSVRLDSGRFIYAPIDHEEIIKVSDLPLPAGLLVEDDDPLFHITSKHDVECAICCIPWSHIMTI